MLMVVVRMRSKEKIFRIESERCECICVRVSAAILSLHLFILTDFCSSRTVPLLFFLLICVCVSLTHFYFHISSLSRCVFRSHPFLSVYQVNKVWLGIDGLMKEETREEEKKKNQTNVIALQSFFK